jgi:chaperonin GroES
MLSPIKPTGDRVIVIRDNPSNKTHSGLLLPDETESNQGTILAVGGGVEDTINIITGATVVFPRYGGQEITVNDQDFVILRESELFGIVEGD